MDGSPSTAILAVLPSHETLSRARSTLLSTLSDSGIGAEATAKALDKFIVPSLNRSSQSPHYYGFVTGGATPAASYADNLVTEHDQNVAVHLPDETIATEVEDAALRMLCDLVMLEPEVWKHRTFTTGATASNVLGLACGREHVIAQAVKRGCAHEISIAEEGIYQAMVKADLEGIQVLTTVPHSSLKKAASILGLGRSSVVDVGHKDETHRFDIAALTAALSKRKVASIVAISASEVNTGFFATSGYDEMQVIRRLCDKHGAWIHVDAAFGLLARILPDTPEYHSLFNGVRGIELADSIGGDAHKLLNVPYDCGIFLSRHLQTGISVLQNVNAAYLDTTCTESTTLLKRYIPSPLNIGLENSRRFRALPVYATLAAYGRQGYQDMLMRQITLARSIARYILGNDRYTLLPTPTDDASVEERLKHIYIIVLCRAKDDRVNSELVQRINKTRRIYVSGTQWDGAPAVRFAVANWKVDPARDIGVIEEVLQEALLPQKSITNRESRL